MPIFMYNGNVCVVLLYVTPLRAPVGPVLPTNLKSRNLSFIPGREFSSGSAQVLLIEGIGRIKLGKHEGL